jgi:hypothetical protein
MGLKSLRAIPNVQGIRMGSCVLAAGRSFPEEDRRPFLFPVKNMRSSETRGCVKPRHKQLQRQLLSW